MDYATFKQKISALIQRSGSRVKVVFYRENGSHIADFSDGTRILGSAYSKKVTVRWNNGNHQGMVAI